MTDHTMQYSRAIERPRALRGCNASPGRASSWPVMQPLAYCLGTLVLLAGLMPARIGRAQSGIELPQSNASDESSHQANTHAAIKRRTTWNEPAKIAGHEKCVDCHKQEIRAWLASKHSARSFDLLRTSDSALEYAEALGIRKQDIASSATCVNCHATPKADSQGRLDFIPGVSCEACHGAASGESGWLNAHAVYGGSSTIRETETPEHFAYRQTRSEQAGQLRSSNLYGLTKRCFNCHIAGDEALAEAGHNQGRDFEMIAKGLGEIRHNFVLNGNSNSQVASLWLNPLHAKANRTIQGRLRVMFVLGQMVDLEISLRNLARATDENDYSDAAITRIEDAYELLAEDIMEEIEDLLDEADSPLQPEASGSTAFDEIAEIVAIAGPVIEALDDDGFSSQATQTYLAAAEAISIVAQRFAGRDGSQLELLDELDLLPEDYFEGAYTP